MDMKQFPSWNHSRTLRTAVELAPAARGPEPSDPLGTLPARGGLIRTGTADLIGLAVQKGEIRASPEAKGVAGTTSG
jgi:hypothetical protein